MTNATLAVHLFNVEKAKKLYIATLDPVTFARDWRTALQETRELTDKALKESSYLRHVDRALEANGGHMLVFRHLVAPPISQDQFKLICPDWPKNSEKDRKPVQRKKAEKVANVFHEWRDNDLCCWLSENRIPSRDEIDSVISRVSVLIAVQRVATAKRNRLANEQEEAVVSLLLESGWTQLPSLSVDHIGNLPAKNFMNRTKLTIGDGAHQEVDISCGIKNERIVAMECKVSNDATNSVKRVADVNKKASSWKNEWGRRVETAALLQGVMTAKEVKKLTDNGVRVFWAHDLDAFKKWINEQL